ncbi:Endoribonuclease L-PSP/chorismate mutase-like protein [Lophiotrema nucula]|uniref:Endoribonuclease L-PSP/chorismate mutase-like protein n=1 Tax=Lophiotrema nucula TaxID=690887 RepID=A0A6A5YW20_9PLEO|nr:Endoribonuclease L-PSP/chorismate mutase-like protein [Lophiotrema nucula]
MSSNPKKEVVDSASAPKPFPVMPFSAAVKSGGMVYVSGNVGYDVKAGKMVEGPIQDRTREALKNISAVLTDAGSSLSAIVKANVYLTDMKDFAAMNEAYLEFFPEEGGRPARTCVQVAALPFGTDVEIECTAHLCERERE